MTEHLITTPAKIHACPACSRHIIACLSGGVPVHADPQPLTTSQEIASLLFGHATYDVLIHGLPRRMYLEIRTVTRIRAGRSHPVVAEHPCAVRAIPPDRNRGIELTFPYPLSPELPFQELPSDCYI